MFATSIITKIIKHISGKLYVYPGGTIAPLLHEAKKEGIDIIVSKNEQGAGYMALSEASLFHRPSFVAVTSGPGITNLITTISDAYFDSVPLIVISGQVGTADLDRCDSIRQRGFQEVSIVDMVKSITKSIFQPRSVEEISEAIHQSIKISMDGRKGPVLIDLPMNIQLININEDTLKNSVNIDNLFLNKKEDDIKNVLLDEIVFSLNNAKKPLVLVGAGAQEEYKLIRGFLEKLKIPTISSLRGLGVIKGDLFHGWIGHTGTPWANSILFEADTILVLGSRLDVRQTGSETKFLDSKTIIHIDVDKEELVNCRIKNTIKINSSIKNFIEKVNNKIEIKNISSWIEEIKEFKKVLKLNDDGENKEGINPSKVLIAINEIIKSKKSFITTGVGSHQHWAARYIDFDNNKCRLFTSAGHGTMGYGLPTAIGLQYLNKDDLVICIDGDGSFQMNIQELALIKELNLKVKILLLNNDRLSLVSQFQNITFNDDPTTGNVVNPDFTAIVNAYGIESLYMDVYNSDLIKKWINSDNASFLHVKIKYDAPISPMLLGGQKLNEMWYYEKK